MRIAFHTPLNAYADGGISGDRRMARQLVAVLESLGHAVTPVEAPRGFMASADAAAFARHEATADRLAQTLLAGWREGAPAPDLWFSYHNYYKAPDLLGPPIAARLGIPYVIAEGSDSQRRASGPWAAHAAAARRGFREADLHLCFTSRDRAGLAAWGVAPHRLRDLPPFVAFDQPPPQRGGHNETIRLATIAMMREGTKENSYLTLARILARVADKPWTLTIIGDGRRRGEVAHAFSGFGEGRIAFRGALDRDQALAELAAHDLFIWPGVREAYGLVYLEAQGVGLPVIAFDSGGVSATVSAGETALLAREGDEAGFAALLSQLISDRALRECMGQAARRFVLEERTPIRAAALLDEALAAAVANRAAKRAVTERAGA